MEFAVPGASVGMTVGVVVVDVGEVVNPGKVWPLVILPNPVATGKSNP